MASSAESAAALAARLGVVPGLVVQELGWDEDSDEQLRAAIAAAIDGELVDADFDDVVDMVLFWFRDGDDDLVEALMDAIHPLTDQGVIWLLTPKPGRTGFVEPEEITEAAPSAGLQATSTISAAPNWQGTRLVAPKAKR
ncbi:MAG: DUF3052 domain-containing protein [Candidatus Nanopelagicales bacterium]